MIHGGSEEKKFSEYETIKLQDKERLVFLILSSNKMSVGLMGLVEKFLTKI